jgi:hypothetical protein
MQEQGIEQVKLSQCSSTGCPEYYNLQSHCFCMILLDIIIVEERNLFQLHACFLHPISHHHTKMIYEKYGIWVW